VSDDFRAALCPIHLVIEDSRTAQVQENSRLEAPALFGCSWLKNLSRRSLKAETTRLSSENKAFNMQETIAGAVSKINFFHQNLSFGEAQGPFAQNDRFYVKPEDKPRS
jgi:hypothetical protein